MTKYKKDESPRGFSIQYETEAKTKDGVRAKVLGDLEEVLQKLSERMREIGLRSDDINDYSEGYEGPRDWTEYELEVKLGYKETNRTNRKEEIKREWDPYFPA